MWKVLVTIAVVISLGDAQRSFYAPRPGSYPKLLPRYRKNETDISSTTDSGLQMRQGDPNFAFAFNSKFPPEFHGTVEEQRFVQRVSQWPEDKQPFWYKNRYAISSMTDRKIDGGDVVRPTTGSNQRPTLPFRSPFLGPMSSGLRSSPNVAQLERNNDDFYGNNELSQRSQDPLVLYLRRIQSS